MNIPLFVTLYKRVRVARATANLAEPKAKRWDDGDAE